MNEKHFGMRLPKADYEMLVELAENDRSTVAQQVRQAVARYIALVDETSRMRKRMLASYDSWAEILDNACETMEMSGLHAESSYKELKRLHAEMCGLMTPNVELTGSRAGLSPVSPATEGSEVERLVGGAK